MKLVDRLLIKANKLVRSSDKRLGTAFLTETDGIWKAKCQLWSGDKYPCDVEVVVTEHKTLEEAKSAITLLAEQHPNPDGCLVFHDYGWPED